MILVVAPNILLLLPILDIPLLLANSVPALPHLPVRHPAVVRLDNIGMCHRAAEPAIARQPRLPIVRPDNIGMAVPV